MKPREAYETAVNVAKWLPYAAFYCAGVVVLTGVAFWKWGRK